MVAHNCPADRNKSSFKKSFNQIQKEVVLCENIEPVWSSTKHQATNKRF